MSETEGRTVFTRVTRLLQRFREWREARKRRYVQRWVDGKAPHSDSVTPPYPPEARDDHSYGRGSG
jgi:hypothetical protein